jgi:hypothetical protein
LPAGDDKDGCPEEEAREGEEGKKDGVEGADEETPV